ncbi:hypothetical protein ACNI3Q_02230 [Sphingomonas sp. FW199]|uniref:hypothetical protein n=1 Tax=Sphingomonas sp. FW199 TaxID=3400217 RepID=UPI003CF135B8
MDLNAILNQFAGNDATIENLGQKLGLSPEHVQAAVAALAKFHPMDVNTAEGAAAETGLPVDTLNQIIGQIGGEGSLGRFAQVLGDDKSGGIGGMLGDIAGNFFGKK